MGASRAFEARRSDKQPFATFAMNAPRFHGPVAGLVKSSIPAPHENTQTRRVWAV